MLPPPAGFMPSSWDLPPGKAVSGMSLMLAGCDMTSSALILPPADGASRTNWHARCPPGPCPWLPPPADWMPELCPPWISQAPQRQSRNGGGAAIDYSVPSWLAWRPFLFLVTSVLLHSLPNRLQSWGGARVKMLRHFRKYKCL